MASVVLATIRAALILMVLAVWAFGAAAYYISQRGLSARDEPTRAETLVARTMRRLATPGDMRLQANPLPPSADVVEEGLRHFADHCAVCHGNDGSGDTTYGRNMYPRAPDMRQAETQSLTDGELFSIIEGGIRLTGMPAFGSGTEEGERSSWALVHFVRRLPSITQEEIARMEALNPKTPEQLREEEEIRRFLEGADPAPPAEPPSHEGPNHE